MPEYTGVNDEIYTVRGVEYVRLWWYTGTGSDRNQKSIGRKSSLTRAKINKARRAKQDELSSNPSMVAADRSPTLEQWVSQYKKLRPELSEGTTTLIDDAHALFKEWQGGDVRIDKIKPIDVANWRTWLLDQDGRSKTFDDGETGCESMLPSSVAKHMRTLSTLFGPKFGAMKYGWVPVNPFANERKNVKTDVKPPAPVTSEDVQRMVDCATEPGMKCLIALTGWTGMRLGEAKALTWANIQWGRRRLTIKKGKTGARDVLMEPQLEAVLSAVVLDATSDLVCDISEHNLQAKLHKVAALAGLDRWQDPFHGLRRWREIDWVGRYPFNVVTAWLGHSPTVALANYLSVDEEFYQDDTARRLMQSIRKLDATGVQEVSRLVESLQIGATPAQHGLENKKTTEKSEV